MNGIEKIKGSLKELLCQNNIIARCELLLRTYDIVRAANLDSEEIEELGSIVGKHIASGIFANMLSQEPIFIDIPKLDAYTQMNGRIFHFLHSKRLSKKDFDDANRKFLQSLPELKLIQLKILDSILIEFLRNAGYRIDDQNFSSQESGLKGMLFSADERRLKAFVFPSIKSLDLDPIRKKLNNSASNSGECDCAILVPSSENFDPFLNFFRKKGQEAEETGFQIWVVNLEKGTVNPFIGFTTDMDIYNQFENPKLSEIVRSTWSKQSY